MDVTIHLIAFKGNEDACYNYIVPHDLGGEVFSNMNYASAYEDEDYHHITSG